MENYKSVNTKFKIEDSMEKDEILVAVELGIDSSKYGDEPVILNIQAYWGDEGERKFGGNGTHYSKNSNPVVIRKVKLTKKGRIF